MDATNQNRSPKKASRGRVVAASIVGFLTVPILVVAITGRWASGTLLDTSDVTKKTEQILAEPAVVSAMGDFLGEELMQIYDENVDIVESLPKELQEQGKVIEDALRKELTVKATSLVGSGMVQETLTQLVGGFHSQMVGVLEDDPQSAASAVTLNLVPVATELMKGLQDSGLLPDDLKIPEIDLTLAPEQQVDALSKALEIELPTEMGSVEVFSADDVAKRNDNVEDARKAVSTGQTVGWIALIASLVLIVCIWFLAGSRRAGSVIAGVTLAIAGIVGLVFARQIPGIVATNIDDDLAREAVRVSIQTLGSGLTTTNIVVTALGCVSIAAGTWGTSVIERVSARRGNRPEN